MADFQHLRDRAYRHLAQAGGECLRADLERAVLGATGAALWTDLLGQALAAESRFEPTATGWRLRSTPAMVDQPAGQDPAPTLVVNAGKAGDHGPATIPPDVSANLIDPSRTAIGGHWVALAVETTGGRPERHRILGLAVAAPMASGVTLLFAESLNPERRVSERAAARAGLALEHLDAAPTFPAIADRFIECLGDATIVAIDARDTWAFVQRELQLDGRLPLANPVVELAAVVANSLVVPPHGKPSLANLARAVGAPVPTRPGAAQVARTVARVAEASFQAKASADPGAPAPTLRCDGCPVAQATWSPAAPLGFCRQVDRDLELAPLGDLVAPVPWPALRDPSAAWAIPAGPGVYTFFDELGQVIYVGRSLNLRRRLQSYAAGALRHTRNLDGLLHAVARVEWAAQPHELAAMLVEAEGIACHQPRFNVQRATKPAALWLRLDIGATWPRVNLARQPQADGAEYTGPFRVGAAAGATLRRLAESIPICVCRRRLGVARNRHLGPCRRGQRGLCLDPSTRDVEASEYGVAVDAARAFLAGDVAPASATARARAVAAAQVGDRVNADRWRQVVAALQQFDLRADLGDGVEPPVAALIAVAPTPEQPMAPALTLNGAPWVLEPVQIGETAAQLAERLRGAGVALAAAATRPDEIAVSRRALFARWWRESAERRNSLVVALPENPDAIDWLASARELLSRVGLAPVE